MPLEQYGSLIDRLKAEEEERLMRERDAAMQAAVLQSNPEISGSVNPNQAAIDEALQWQKDNPPPERSLANKLFNALGVVGGVLQGRRYKTHDMPDPMKDFRNHVVQTIVNQGMAGAQARKTQEEGFRQKTSPQALEFEQKKKASPGWMHPSQVQQNEASAAKMLAEKPSNIEQVLRRQKAEEDVRKLRLENERTGRFVPLEQAGIEQGMKQLRPSQPTPGQNSPLDYVGEYADSAATDLLTNGQRVIDLRGKEGAIGWKGAQAGISSTAPQGAFDEQAFRRWYAQQAAKTGINPNPDDPQHKYDYRAAYMAGAEPGPEGHWPSQFKAPDHPNRFVNGIDTITGRPIAGNPAAQTRPELSFDFMPGGTGMHLKQVPTQEALSQQRIAELKDKFAYGSLPVEIQTRVGNNLQAFDILQKMKSLYSPEMLGPLANALADYKKMGGVLSPQHQAMRSEIGNLTNLLFHVRTGAAGPEGEQRVMNEIAPDLYSGNPRYFFNALQRLEQLVKGQLDADSSLASTPTGELGNLIHQRTQQLEQRDQPSAAYNAGVQPPYPKGAPAGLTYDPKIGKWRMP